MTDTTFPYIDALTERERDVLLAIAEGLSNQEIANSLHIALATVKWYNSQIYSKLGVSNRDDAVNRARLLGLLDSDKGQVSSIPHNLPQENTPFVGRKTELRELHDLLNDANTRLLTILAQGGMGKTRLALRLAQENLLEFSDGVYLIQLAPLENDKAVATALANALGLQHYDNSVDMQANIVKYLQSQQMLLIFDNFEHVLGATALVSAILQAAPHIKILATSRERLNLQGEIVYALLGMADSDEAIELFLQSSQRIRPDYELNHTDLPHITEICRLVDGLPLGIELAAAWMDTLSAENIAEEIQKSIDILETDLRDVPERHRSIQATFDYTWESLSTSEQETMMSLSLFRGGFTQDAAETVALADIRRLKRLVNKSLLYRDPFGRYSIHELLRQFCFDKLNASDYNTVLDNFMDYMAEFVDSKLEPMLNFDGNAYAAIRNEWDNIAFAWSKMLAYQRYDLINQCFTGIWRFSSLQGHSYECVALFAPVIEQLRPLARDNSELETLFAALLVRQADLMVGIDSPEITQELNDEAIAILEKQAPSSNLIHAYFTKLSFKYDASNYEEDKVVVEKIIQLANEMQAYQYILSAYPFLWRWEEFTQDESAYQASLDHAYQLWTEYRESDIFIAYAYGAAVHVLFRLGKVDECRQFIMQGLLQSERAGWLFGISKNRIRLMKLSLHEGKLDEYKAHVASVIHWHHKYGRDWQLLGALQGFHGGGLMVFNEYEKAAEVFSFVYHHPVTVEIAKTELLKHLDEVRDNLDAAIFEAAWERGKQYNLKNMVDEAMAFWSE